MIGSPRAGLMLLATAVAGVLLWVAAQFGRHTTGGYWAAYGIVAAAGVVLALAQLRGRTGHPPAMFLLGFLPVLIAGGWVLLAMQPHGTWSRDHVLTWSGNIGIRDVVHDVATWLGVIAFGPSDDVPLLAGRTEVDGRTAVYLCERFACALPVTEPALLPARA